MVVFVCRLVTHLVLIHLVVVALSTDVDVCTPGHGREDQIMIHIHGFHRTGTGFTHDFVQAIFQQGYVAVFQDPGGEAFEDRKFEFEGQHYQTLFMKFRDTTKNSCTTGDPRLTTSRGIRYLCPKEVQQLTSPAMTLQNSLTLCRSWGSYLNMSKQVLLQKSPTMKPVLLDRLSYRPTFHLILMRHPRIGIFGRGTRPSSVCIWFDVIGYMMQELANNRVARYAVVQFETQIRFPLAVRAELGTLMEESFPWIRLPIDLTQEHSRKYKRKLLERRTDFDLSKMCPKDEDTEPCNVSGDDSVCSPEYCAVYKNIDFINTNIKIASHLGYNLTHCEDLNQNPEMLLFTHNKPPDATLLKLFATRTKLIQDGKNKND